MFSSFLKSLTGESSSSSSSKSKNNNTSSSSPTSSNQHQDPTAQQQSSSPPLQTRTIASYLSYTPGQDGPDSNNNSFGNNNNGRIRIPDELVEIDREWSAIKSYFDAAIIGEVGVAGTDSATQNEVNQALSSQLSELDAKLKRIVALIFCGGKLPSTFEKDLAPGAVVRWERVPNPTKNRSAKALLRCRREGVSIFSVACQHAKLNLPPGSRSVLSSFMLEMLAMMEVSSNWVTIPPTPENSDTDQNQQQGEQHEQDGGGAASSSSPNASFRKKDTTILHQHTIGDVLVENKHTVCEPLVNFLAKTSHEVIRCVQFHHHEEERNEKLYYARLIRYLCEAVAQQGERLLYDPYHNHHNTTNQGNSSSPSNNNNNNTNFHAKIKSLADAGQLTLPWLLEIVTIFSRADDLYPVAPQALECSLRAHLVLAVSKYDIIGGNNNNNTSNHNDQQQQQQSLLSNSDLFDSLLSHLGFTFVTLCRLEENQEFGDHLSIISTTMKYLDSLFVFAPHVVDATFVVASNNNSNNDTKEIDDLPSKFFKFLLGTVTEMVKLPSDRSFIVSMLLLSQMMESSISVPGQSPIPTLIAQAVLCHSHEIAEAFFSRLSDISIHVRTAAANFLVSALKCCPMLFVSMIGRGGVNALISSSNKKKDSSINNNNNNSTNNNIITELSSENIGDLFPPVTNLLLHDNLTVRACSLQFERARTKIIYNETRGGEEAPGLEQLHNTNNNDAEHESSNQEDEYDEDEDEKNFQKLSEYFVKNFKKSLSYDLQQYTTYDSSHCAVLSGLIVELMSLPSTTTTSLNINPSSLTPFKFVSYILREALPSISQHVTARLARINDRARNVIEEIVQHSPGTTMMGVSVDESSSSTSSSFMSLDDGNHTNGNVSNNSNNNTNNTSNNNVDSLMQVQQRVPDEFKAFARGAVHLTQLRMELWSVLRAKEEQQRLREIDPDE